MLCGTLRVGSFCRVSMVMELMSCAWTWPLLKREIHLSLGDVTRKPWFGICGLVSASSHLKPMIQISTVSDITQVEMLLPLVQTMPRVVYMTFVQTEK